MLICVSIISSSATTTNNNQFCQIKHNQTSIFTSFTWKSVCLYFCSCSGATVEQRRLHERFWFLLHDLKWRDDSWVFRTILQNIKSEYVKLTLDTFQPVNMNYCDVSDTDQAWNSIISKWTKVKRRVLITWNRTDLRLHLSFVYMVEVKFFVLSLFPFDFAWGQKETVITHVSIVLWWNSGWTSLGNLPLWSLTFPPEPVDSHTHGFINWAVGKY